VISKQQPKKVERKLVPLVSDFIVRKGIRFPYFNQLLGLLFKVIHANCACLPVGRDCGVFKLSIDDVAGSFEKNA
jgi:hypothetical protein